MVDPVSAFEEALVNAIYRVWLMSPGNIGLILPSYFIRNCTMIKKFIEL